MVHRLSAANRCGLIEAGIMPSIQKTLRLLLSAANRCGLIEAPVFAHLGEQAVLLSAANRCGLIEAGYPSRHPAPRRRRYPQRTAAASLKRAENYSRDAVVQRLSAANRCGLIEAEMPCYHPIRAFQVIRSEPLRPH